MRTLRSMPLPAPVSLTVAPANAAPEGSATCPPIALVVSPCGLARGANRKAIVAIAARERPKKFIHPVYHKRLHIVYDLN